MELFEFVTKFLKDDMSYVAHGGTVKKRYTEGVYDEFMKEVAMKYDTYPGTPTIATQLMWHVLSSVSFFMDDGVDIVLRPDFGIVKRVLDFCADHGADFNTNINYVIEHYECYGKLISMKDSICHFYLADFQEEVPSMAVISTAYAVASPYGERRDDSRDVVSYIFSHITTPMTDYDVYVCNMICIIKRVMRQTPKVPLVDIFQQYPAIYNNRLPYSILKNAIIKNDIVIVEYYLNNVNDIAIDPIDVFTAIRTRTRGISVRICGFLSKEQLEVSDVYGNTPLIMACKYGNAPLVKTLLSKKVNINVRNRFNETPLFWACKNRNPDIFKLLIDNGASFDSMSLIIAKKYNHQKISKFLVAYTYAKLWRHKTLCRIVRNTNTKLSDDVINMIAHHTLK